jgi:hypothetical protein
LEALIIYFSVDFFEKMENRPPLTQISAAAFAAKFQSKRGKSHYSECHHSYILVSSHFFFCAEVYRFLSCEVRAYLPGYETVTVWHLRDLAMGVKTIIHCDNVKVITVPQFEGLAILQIFAFAANTVDVQNALPPSKEISKLSRAYLSNVIYTIIGEPFQQWVH